MRTNVTIVGSDTREYGANARLRMFINVCEMFRIGTFYQSMGSYPIEVLIRLYIRLDLVRKNSYLQYTIYTQSCRLVYYQEGLAEPYPSTRIFESFSLPLHGTRGLRFGSGSTSG